MAALKIRARLDAYFGPAAVNAWEILTTYVNTTLSSAFRLDEQDASVPLRFDVQTPPGPLKDLLFRFYSRNPSTDPVINEIAAELLKQEQSVARSILAMNVRGYSTTWHDLRSDLFPNL